MHGAARPPAWRVVLYSTARPHRAGHVYPNREGTLNPLGANMALSLSIPIPMPQPATQARRSCMIHGALERDRAADCEINVNLATLIAGDFVL
jgi:hypothetical protein